MAIFDTAMLWALGLLAGVAFLASVWQSISEYNLAKKERERHRRKQPPK